VSAPGDAREPARGAEDAPPDRRHPVFHVFEEIYRRALRDQRAAPAAPLPNGQRS
jgi:hypothetical protein